MKEDCAAARERPITSPIAPPVSNKALKRASGLLVPLQVLSLPSE